MAKDKKCAGYVRFATRSQADPETEKKLETVKLLQEIGYCVAVAPDDYDGDQKNCRICRISPAKLWMTVYVIRSGL